MNNTIIINNHELQVKEYNGQRVVTFKDIDECHERPEGTARKRFNDNKKHFVEGTDFFSLKPSDSLMSEKRTLEIPNRGIIAITETGYMMLVKSFTDDLAWEVQRLLVNSYFKVKADALPQTMEEIMIYQLQELKRIRETATQAETLAVKANDQIQQMRDVIALSPTGWRKNTTTIITRIAQKLGGNDYIQTVREECYKLLEERAHVALGIRLTNKRKNMAENGTCKSKRDKLNKLDVIGEDPKVLECFLAIVKEMAIKYGITIPEQFIISNEIAPSITA